MQRWALLTLLASRIVLCLLPCSLSYCDDQSENHSRRLWPNTRLSHFLSTRLRYVWCVLQAQQVAQYVQKGMQIAVGGHLKQSKWTDKTTGQRREALRVSL